MRKLILAAAIAFSFLPAAQSQTVSLNIGINMPSYPALAPIPGYPVYWDPRAPYNYFFYDGLYWVFIDDNWYASDWYNGPWRFVAPEYVPVYVLRVPVRYYHRPPAYFRRWAPGGAPHWGEHWGPDWERQHHDWNRWDRHATPAPAPLPHYQREYRGERYPHAPEQQQQIREQQYRYQPREPAVRQHFQEAPQMQPVPQPRMQPQPHVQRRGPEGQEHHHGGGRDDDHDRGR
ncbi:MAG TPA: hypothetical protein VL593_08915 [Ramlibacter sp.]|jgi:hypothetical protein|nr:hypothetical protein [Ramlibacter sp.]